MHFFTFVGRKIYNFAIYGVLAHPVERNTGSVEVSGSSPLCSTIFITLSYIYQ